MVRVRIATDLSEVAITGRDCLPQRHDRALATRLALRGLDRPFASRHAPEDCTSRPGRRKAWAETELDRFTQRP